MDIDRINKVISYISSNVSSIEKTNEVSYEVEKAGLNNCSIKRPDNSSVIAKEDYGADRYLICNPNVLYRYVNRSFITKDTFKVNKAAYAEAAKKYGHKNIMKKKCFEESYI